MEDYLILAKNGDLIIQTAIQLSDEPRSYLVDVHVLGSVSPLFDETFKKSTCNIKALKSIGGHFCPVYTDRSFVDSDEMQAFGHILMIIHHRGDLIPQNYVPSFNGAVDSKGALLAPNLESISVDFHPSTPPAIIGTLY